VQRGLCRDGTLRPFEEVEVNEICEVGLDVFSGRRSFGLTCRARGVGWSRTSNDSRAK
jgi:hypothetical protein